MSSVSDILLDNIDRGAKKSCKAGGCKVRVLMFPRSDNGEAMPISAASTPHLTSTHDQVASCG